MLLLSAEPARTPPSLRLVPRGVQARHQTRRRHLSIRGGDQTGDDTPVGLAVDAHADPAEVADVGRPEEPRRVLVDEGLLHSRPRRQPDGEVIRAVMVRVRLGEYLPGAPGGLTPGDLLDDLREREADAAQPLDRRGLRP